jgi:hypothetical protein
MERETPLSRFVDSERTRFRSEDNNKFAFSLSQISRYQQFTTVVFGRYQNVSEEFIANVKAQQKSFLEGTHKATDDQMFLVNESARLSILLHVEIESFYLFAKILLDKVAHSIEFYFGSVRKRPLDSHDDLYKNLTVYARRFVRRLFRSFDKRQPEYWPSNGAPLVPAIRLIKSCESSL